MVQVNLTEGARLAGVSRSTLNRHIREGRITKVTGTDGKPCLDTEEIQRVYHDTVGDETVAETETTGPGDEVNILGTDAVPHDIPADTVRSDTLSHDTAEA